MSKAIYRPGDAADELSMFPTPDTHINGPLVNPRDPGLGLIESIRLHDPDYKIALELTRELLNAHGY